MKYHLVPTRVLLLLSALLLAAPRAGAASTNRGVWCWKSPSPYGLNYIIGDPAIEDAAVSQFKVWGISRIYGSYGELLKTAQGQAALAVWNSRLSRNGIESQLLISDTSWGSGDHNILLSMISFNTNQPADAQLKAVHLDIEPWGLASWGTGDKYQALLGLADVYQSVRNELNANGLTNVLMYADLADWLDNLGTINWPSVLAREQWYSGILTNLASITLMAYEQPSFSRILNVVSWEMVDHPGAVRIGIDAGAGKTWSDLAAFRAVADQLESYYSDSAGIDIYDFASFEMIVPPVLRPGAAPPMSGAGFNLLLQGPLGSNYVIGASTDLANWQTITNFTGTAWLNYFCDPVATNYPSRFYRVESP